MAVTRAEIVTTALNLLDEVGLDGLTLRRLARELGISAPTLYWHIRDKRELLDLVAERIIAAHKAGQSPIADIADPWERVAESFRRQYHAIIAHRDGARVFAGNRPTEAMLPVIEQWLDLWVKSGFPPGETLSTIIGIGNYVVGAALEYQAEIERSEGQRLDPETRRAMIAPYPNLTKAIAARHRHDPEDRHSDFEHGLALLIAGLKVRRQALLEENPAAGRNEDAVSR